VLFITVPMYYKHIHNYDSWEIRLKEELQKYPNHKWLNLQAPYDTVIYTPDKFEDTYTENQHLSNSGMIVTAYKLSEFIENNYPNLLPDRSKETAWINDFKTTDYFAYNQNITSAPRSREGRSSTSGRGPTSARSGTMADDVPFASALLPGGPEHGADFPGDAGPPPGAEKAGKPRELLD